MRLGFIFLFLRMIGEKVIMSLMPAVAMEKRLYQETGVNTEESVFI